MTQANDSILAAVETHLTGFFQKNISADYVYHDLQHVQNVVKAVKEIGERCDLGDKELEILQIAAWFHDSGYDNGPEGHEERSCIYATEFLSKRDFPSENVEAVCRCIMATKTPHRPQGLLEEIICDADLSHLKKKIYWDRSGRVRQELLLTKSIVMSEQEWVDFELDFLNNHRFFTAVAYELFEAGKLKHIQQLRKHKQRLCPNEVKTVEGVSLPDKKKKKKKRAPSMNNNTGESKQSNLGRGVETMFRTTYRTHVNLSSIADNKANLMLSINAIIISIVLPQLVPRFGDNPKLIIPTIIMLLVCLLAIVFATLSTRPKITEGKFTREDIAKKRSNLLFFGNFYKMKIEDYHWGMMEMIKDSDFLYSSMTRDLYYLGKVLAKKYHYLSICYYIFMYGMIVAVLSFAISFLV